MNVEGKKMKTLFIGDLHLQGSLILSKLSEEVLDVERIIFMGDYFDQWGQDKKEQLYRDEANFLFAWKLKMEEKGVEVVCILGNHDMPYIIDKPRYYSMQEHGTVRYLRKILLALKPQIAYRMNDVLISHAGFAGKESPEDWMFQALTGENIIENYFRFEELESQVGRERGGIYPYGSCIWSDLHVTFKAYNINCNRQVVGHTPVRSAGVSYALGQTVCADDKVKFPEIYATDTFSLFRDYQPIGDRSLLAYDDVEDKFTILKNDWTVQDEEALVRHFVE